ncbi:hypothetical protein GFH30_00940 [Acinetobacter wanghuae]|uniref:Uncharacterized protein n=1 Tax=Acinetobacter wanghuae TaxID=2662362 RepID=A0A5Q0P0S2_9GAMM|nr:hypothetical protein [Acinetobacter wanghuae]MQW91953.1 hypothetical protein [Acinetobacter wanghuae]QGA10050.1 hypothetical protein GFH30_00940 [Acinetobacter wanghuae]
MANTKVVAFRPLDCDDMERSIQLCNGIEYLIDEFLRQTNGKESRQLLNSEYQHHLLKIADHLEELIHRLTYLADKNNKEFYFSHLYSILKSLNCMPNTLIITAFYLDPTREFKRLVNRNTFNFEVGQIVKKIKFIKSVLQSLYVGRKSGIKLISKM